MQTQNVRIKQLDNRIATAGIHLGGGPERRKLEPGEVLALGGELFDGVWNTGKVEITPERPTRPLDYADYDEARYCSPSFNPRDDAEFEASEKARAAVAKRLNDLEFAENQPADEQPAAVEKAADKPADTPKKTKAPKQTATAAPTGRAARRANLKSAQNGAESTP